jgi:hypothetical protein
MSEKKDLNPLVVESNASPGSRFDVIVVGGEDFRGWRRRSVFWRRIPKPKCSSWKPTIELEEEAEQELLSCHPTLAFLVSLVEPTWGQRKIALFG